MSILSGLEVCPFNPSHRVSALKMPHHILKCKKNYPNVEVKYCPFNARHLLPVSAYDSHIEDCPDKKQVEIEAYWQEVEEQKYEEEMKKSRASSLCGSINSLMFNESEKSHSLYMMNHTEFSTECGYSDASSDSAESEETEYFSCSSARASHSSSSSEKNVQLASNKGVLSPLRVPNIHL